MGLGIQNACHFFKKISKIRGGVFVYRWYNNIAKGTYIEYIGYEKKSGVYMCVQVSSTNAIDSSSNVTSSRAKTTSNGTPNPYASWFHPNQTEKANSNRYDFHFYLV